MSITFYQIGWSMDMDPDIEGDHPYFIPRVKCPICGESRATSHTYPWIDLTKIFDSKNLLRLDALDEAMDYTWDEFKRHSNVIRLHLDADYPLASWASFGQFSGKIYKNPADIICTDEPFLFMRRSVLDVFKQEGFEFSSFQPLLKGAKEEFLEIWVPPVGMSPDFGFCPECQRGGTKFKGAIRADTIPAGTHLFRLKNNPNFLNFSPEFFETVKRHGFTGLNLARQVIC